MYKISSTVYFSIITVVIVGKKSKKSKSKSRTMLTEDAILAEVMKQSELEYQEHQKQVQESDSETKGEAKFDDAMEKVLSESTNHFEKYIYFFIQFLLYPIV